MILRVFGVLEKFGKKLPVFFSFFVMSYLLALETSGKSLSVALFLNGDLIEEIFCPPDDRSHSEKLLPSIHELLSRHLVTPNSQINFAVAVGAGSFTSLRVGMATVLGLAKGWGGGIHPVSSLKALAFQVKNSSALVAPILKAGRGKVYAGLFERESTRMNTVLPEGVFELDDLMGRLEAFKKEIIFVGAPELAIHEKGKYLDSIKPGALSVGLLALQENATPLSPDEIELPYLQNPDLGIALTGAFLFLYSQHLF